MLMVDAVTPVVVPPCGRPHAPPAAGWPPGTNPLPVPPLSLLTVPPLLLPPTATVPGPVTDPGLVPPGPGTVFPPGTVPPGAPGTPLLAAAMAAGDPDLRVAVASGLSPQAVVSAVRAMAPASSCRPVRGRFIVVSELRGAGGQESLASAERSPEEPRRTRSRRLPPPAPTGCCSAPRTTDMSSSSSAKAAAPNQKARPGMDDAALAWATGFSCGVDGAATWGGWALSPPVTTPGAGGTSPTAGDVNVELDVPVDPTLDVVPLPVFVTGADTGGVAVPGV